MAEPQIVKFHDLELDDRILKAIAKEGWTEPTLIQERAIPLILQGKDVLVKARTGSGKTGAFAIPIIQKILNSKLIATEQAVKALVLAPSRELCQQVARNFEQLTYKCSRDVRILDISPQVDVNVQRPLLVSKPDVVVSTPARALLHLKSGSLVLKESLEVLIIDEADLVLAHGYESETTALLEFLPSVYQAILASATLSDDVLQLKKLILHNAVTLKLEEPSLAPTSQLQHYHLFAEEKDKAAILYALIKLHLLRGKTIIFVNNVDRCFKLKLFLEQFNVRTVVLNSELPAATRCHAVNQFNEGIYDIIIASDETVLAEPATASSSQKKKKKKKKEEKEEKEEAEEKASKRKSDKESGVSRGIDFQFVSNVINFDFPLDIKSYIHRAGRTARGKNKGTALSFVSLLEQPRMHQVENYLKNEHSVEENVMKAYQFKLEEVEAFRYRARDAWTAVTKIAIREARIKEIKQELFNTNELKSYFEDNPRDLQSLRHDKALHTVKVHPHLANVPDYIVPDALRKLSGIGHNRKRRRFHQKTPRQEMFLAARSNPLMSMEFEGFGKRQKK
ncbi:probable ATP-dependent RNA helicase DDX56 [Thrips palmi]|uniref:RNA helicase n=1 Tax=Thrips palmi TaxID=161013 RepID=A0A6P8Z4N1_THRPL|nr:probable ATP-dependent RNA helicase DDX56 [Thrips palmi]